MATLDDLTQSLQEQNQKTDEYRKSLDTLVSELTNNFGAFLNESSKDRLAQIEAQREAAAAAKRASGIRIGSGDKTIGSQNNFGGMFAGLGIGKLGVGIGAAGAGIAAFFLGLAGAERIMGKFGNGENLKNLMKNLAEGLGYFGTSELLTVGALLAGSALFVAMPGLGGGDIVVGMGAIGLGIGGFFAGLGVGDALLTFMDVDGARLASQMKHFAEGLGAFSDRDLIAVGALLATGTLFSMKRGGKGKLVTGLGAIGLGIGAFFGGLGVGDKLLQILRVDGTLLKNMMKNVAEGLGAFSDNSLMALGALFTGSALFSMVPGGKKGMILGIGAIGLGLGLFFGGLGIGDAILSFIGADGESLKKIMINLALGLSAFAPLAEFDAVAVGAGLASIAGGLVAFFGGALVGTLIEKTDDFINWITGGETDKKNRFEKLVDSLKPLEKIDPSKLNNLDLVSKKLNNFKNSLDNISGIDLTKFAQSITSLGRGVEISIGMLPKMATGGKYELEVPGLNKTYDFGPEGSGGLLNLNAPIGEMTEAMNKLRGLISPNQTTNNYYGSPTSGARFNPVVYNPAPQTGSVMDGLLREFNANQGRPTVIVSDSSSKTNAPVTNNQQTFMSPATPTNDRKAAALGEWSPSF